MTSTSRLSSPPGRRRLDLKWCPSARLECFLGQTEMRMGWRILPCVSVAIANYEPITGPKRHRIPLPIGAAANLVSAICPCLMAANSEHAERISLRNNSKGVRVCRLPVLVLFRGEAGVETPGLPSFEYPDEIMTVSVLRAMRHCLRPRSQQRKRIRYVVLNGDILLVLGKRIAFGFFPVFLGPRGIVTLVRAVGEEPVVREHPGHADRDDNDVANAGKWPRISGCAFSALPLCPDHEMVLAHPRLSFRRVLVRRLLHIIADHKVARATRSHRNKHPWLIAAVVSETTGHHIEIRLERICKRSEKLRLIDVFEPAWIGRGASLRDVIPLVLYFTAKADQHARHRQEAADSTDQSVLHPGIHTRLDALRPLGVPSQLPERRH